MKHRVQVVPVRLRERNRELEVDSVRVVAYRAVCSCGWRGQGRQTIKLARADHRGHVADVTR